MINRGSIAIVAITTLTFVIAGGLIERVDHQPSANAQTSHRASAAQTAPGPALEHQPATAQLNPESPATERVSRERPLRRVTPKHRHFAAPPTSVTADTGAQASPSSNVIPEPKHASRGSTVAELRQRARTGNTSPSDLPSVPSDAPGASPDSTKKALTFVDRSLPLAPPLAHSAWLFDSPSDLDDWTVVWQSEGLEVEPVWGDDEIGYVSLWVPFRLPNQAIQFGVSYPEDSPADLTGRTLRLRIRLAAGGGSGGVQLFSQSAGWVWIAHGWTGFDSLAEWTDLTLDLDADSGDFDPTTVLRVGVQLHSGAGKSFETNEVHIDSFVIE